MRHLQSVLIPLLDNTRETVTFRYASYVNLVPCCEYVSFDDVANVEVAKLETGLPTLASISGGAPMIGFLGTVVGMVQVFMGMSGTEGAIELSQLSEGMYVAMVTTVGGLIVGIPAYFAYNYLVARIEKLIFRMEATTIAFMDILNQPVQK